MPWSYESTMKTLSKIDDFLVNKNYREERISYKTRKNCLKGYGFIVNMDKSVVTAAERKNVLELAKSILLRLLEDGNREIVSKKIVTEGDEAKSFATKIFNEICEKYNLKNNNCMEC